MTFCKTEKSRTVPYPLLALALIGASAGVGYKLGVRAGIEQARAPHTTDVARIVIATQTPVAPSAPAAAINNDRIDRIEPASELALADATAAQRVQADAGVARSQPRRAKPGPGLEPAIAAASPPEPSDEAVALQSLDPEVRALKQIERALRKREPERALDLLRQLDRDVPAGKLIEERAAARAVARCVLLAGSATASSSMAIALEFSQRYPASVYFARVRETCRAAIDRGRATDSLAR